MARCVAMLLAVVLCAATSGQALAPPRVTIRDLTIKGTGCTDSDTNLVFSNDYRTVTAIFRGMVATTDSGLPGKRKLCQISFYLDYTNGLSVTLGQVTGRGSADIAKYSKGMYETQFYFSGQTGTGTATRTIDGKFSGNFEFSDNFLNSVYSQCNSAPNLNINAVVQVDGSRAVMGVDFQLVFALIWKQC